MQPRVVTLQKVVKAMVGLLHRVERVDIGPLSG